ncbi:uncharacterized protein BT62DRAFT_923892 [Guyanagaster necrorhizus]|uniref:Uncharacterized protein n=1 Tax=Guyanagaster necrorhizus TaxID=856835 RepID=A0A9P7VIS2_9AGAR|nr:uncharacterized protein BT62DRAFT_923892 [Guyanagaster necrorhizus MCA 3950]KAG7440714.1 hypothetical protein BT62DRAFT_923892 [Guyanagaster necrorhizus MCA 3950]
MASNATLVGSIPEVIDSDKQKKSIFQHLVPLSYSAERRLLFKIDVSVLIFASRILTPWKLGYFIKNLDQYFAGMHEDFGTVWKSALVVIEVGPPILLMKHQCQNYYRNTSSFSKITIRRRLESSCTVCTDCSPAVPEASITENIEDDDRHSQKETTLEVITKCIVIGIFFDFSGLGVVRRGLLNGSDEVLVKECLACVFFSDWMKEEAIYTVLEELSVYEGEE